MDSSQEKWYEPCPFRFSREGKEDEPDGRNDSIYGGPRKRLLRIAAVSDYVAATYYERAKKLSAFADLFPNYQGHESGMMPEGREETSDPVGA